VVGTPCRTLGNWPALRTGHAGQSAPSHAIVNSRHTEAVLVFGSSSSPKSLTEMSTGSGSRGGVTGVCAPVVLGVVCALLSCSGWCVRSCRAQRAQLQRYMRRRPARARENPRDPVSESRSWGGGSHAHATCRNVCAVCSSSAASRGCACACVVCHCESQPVKEYLRRLWVCAQRCANLPARALGAGGDPRVRCQPASGVWRCEACHSRQ
jgi:hypothetical protein